MRYRLYALLLACLVPTIAAAEPTEVTVRVLSKGAKFIGTSMGGVAIRLLDAQTGETLAQGVTRGSTGDTGTIMAMQHARNGVLATPGAAKFDAVLDLAQPRLVRVEARGPVAQPQSAMVVSATQWIVPGKHINQGNGWTLDMPGLVVDALSPPAHARTRVGASLPLRANVSMMCGCPLTPKGLWDAELFEIEAIILRDGEQVATIALDYAGEASQFEAVYQPDQPGAYQAIVVAHQPANGNTGLDRTSFVVAR